MEDDRTNLASKVNLGSTTFFAYYYLVFFLAGRVFSGVLRGVEAENLVMSTRDGFSPAGFFRE